VKAVIIAAGCGSRLKDYHQGIPKTLLSVHGKRIIDDIIEKIVSNGISDIVVITGYKSNLLEEYLTKYKDSSINIQFIHNPRWEEANGLSVLTARKAMSEKDEFILLMSDHIFSKKILSEVVAAKIKTDEALLAIDLKIEEIPDLDDGMKLQAVEIKNSMYQINKFGKDLQDFIAIDTGIFKLHSSFFTSLENSISRGKDSLSDACNLISENCKMKGLDIGNKLWLDIDTPEMLNQETILKNILGITS
jgi:choline kinase